MLDLDEATKNELLLDYIQCVQNVRSELFKFVVPGSKAPNKGEVERIARMLIEVEDKAFRKTGIPLSETHEFELRLSSVAQSR